jgi:hypothetical protein
VQWRDDAAVRSLSAEARFLLLCLREPDAATEEALRVVGGTVRAWSDLVEMARRQRASGYVLRAAEHAGVALPAAASAGLLEIVFACAARALTVDRELEEITATLRSMGVAPIVLKGPGLARTIYPEPSLRPYDDLDLVVDAMSEQAAIEALAQRGYEQDDAAWQNRAGHEHAPIASFHRVFESAGDRAKVELHLDSLQLGLVPVREGNRRERATPLPGVSGALMFCPEDQLLQLCVHAHKHGFDRLIWLKDIDLLVRRTAGTLRWDLVAGDSRSEGVTASVWYALRLTSELLGTPLPECARALRPGPLTRTLYRKIWPIAVIANLQAHPLRRAVQFRAEESLRGVVPSLVLMGRRADRARSIVQVLSGQSPP